MSGTTCQRPRTQKTRGAQLSLCGGRTARCAWQTDGLELKHVHRFQSSRHKATERDAGRALSGCSPGWKRWSSDWSRWSTANWTLHVAINRGGHFVAYHGPVRELRAPKRGRELFALTRNYHPNRRGTRTHRRTVAGNVFSVTSLRRSVGIFLSTTINFRPQSVTPLSKRTLARASSGAASNREQLPTMATRPISLLVPRTQRGWQPQARDQTPGKKA